MDTLYFHNLQPAPEGAYLVTIPPELQDEIAQRWGWLLRDEPQPEPTGTVVRFIVRGPERTDRYGIMVRLEDLAGTPEENLESVRRTMPNEWEVVVRTATM